MNLDLQDAQTLIVNAGLKKTLSSQTHGQLDHYLNLRQKWNRTHNLSGPKAIEHPWRIDVTDGIALAQLLDSDLPLYDVGTGSGIPGLVVKILKPHQEIHLVEPLAKRVAFLKIAVHELKLDGVTIHRAHWPVSSLRACQVVSRAVIAPTAWPQLAAASSDVRTIYRYLAAERPDFGAQNYRLADALDYQRSPDEKLRLERWDTASFSEDDARFKRAATSD